MVTIDREAAPATAVAAVPALVAALTGRRGTALVPTDARLLVAAGARAGAGETVVARWPSGPTA